MPTGIERSFGAYRLFGNQRPGGSSARPHSRPAVLSGRVLDLVQQLNETHHLLQQNSADTKGKPHASDEAPMKVWSITESQLVWSGALVTAGDIAFYGTMDRMFKAVDARSGKLLWQIRAPSGIIGQPVTFVGNDGVQYVAILSGVGGWPGVVANAEIDPRVRNGALGFTGASQDLPLYTVGGGTLLVFSLGKEATQRLEDVPAKPGDPP